ncbi:FdtA/QdtA family cupin domain-containing protein [Flavobacteriaceae bacterium]|nr:FdtA/QdtA family cupin domain-containing protein [Flavobacteriaceae bacterium]
MIKGVQRIDLPKIKDVRGNLSFFENNNQLPFEIKRSYWIYDVPGGQVRGGHSFKKSHELIVALSGSFNVVLNDGKEEVTYFLNRSYNALYVPNLIWRSLCDFSTNSLALIVSNIEYSPQDYITDFNTFLTLKHEKEYRI